MKRTHIFIIYNSDTNIKKVILSLSSVLYGGNYEYYCVKASEVYKIFDTVKDINSDEYVWVINDTIDIVYSGKINVGLFNTDVIYLNPDFLRDLIIPGKECLNTFNIEKCYSKYIMKAKFLKDKKYETDAGVLDCICSAMECNSSVYVSCSVKVVCSEAFKLQSNEKEVIVNAKVKDLQEENNASLKNVSLSIVIVMCDKDYNYVPDLVKSIPDKIKGIPYEILLIDNRNDISYDFTKLIKENNIKYISMGGNKYQYAARVVSPLYANNKYIWFIDADDEILDIHYEDIRDAPNADIIAFNAITDTPGEESKYELSGLFDISGKESSTLVYSACKITVWQHWFRTSMFYRAMKSLPMKRILCNEDTIITLAVLKKSSSIYYTGKFIYKWNKSRGDICSDTLTLDRYKALTTGVVDSFDILGSLEPTGNFKRGVYLSTLEVLLSRLNKIDPLDEWKKASILLLKQFPINSCDEEALTIINMGVKDQKRRQFFWAELLKKLSLGDIKYERICEIGR